MALAERERQDLVETLLSADPDAPTLCEGWTVRHVLAHLVQRDHHPLEFAVDQLEHRPPGQERFLPRLVRAASTPGGYQELVARFAAGGSRLNPLSYGGDAAHLAEFVVHHEDIRRGTGPVEPRALPLETEQAIWRGLGATARMGLRDLPGPIRLEAPGREPRTLGRGEPVTVLRGEPVELLLYALGRRDAADVEVVSSASA